MSECKKSRALAAAETELLGRLVTAHESEIHSAWRTFARQHRQECVVLVLGPAQDQVGQKRREVILRALLSPEYRTRGSGDPHDPDQVLVAAIPYVPGHKAAPFTPEQQAVFTTVGRGDVRVLALGSYAERAMVLAGDAFTMAGSDD